LHFINVSADLSFICFKISLTCICLKSVRVDKTVLVVQENGNTALERDMLSITNWSNKYMVMATRMQCSNAWEPIHSYSNAFRY